MKNLQMIPLNQLPESPKKKIPCFHVALSFSCFFPLKSGEVEFFQKKGIETSSCESVWILKTEHRSGFWTHATSQKKLDDVYEIVGASGFL